jgi:hypothetical protein
MFIYGLKQGETFHYVGQTCQKLNLRFNWHVWASRHPNHKLKNGTCCHRPIHEWMATQDLTSITPVVLAETDDEHRLTILEGEFTKKLLAEGHPLKTTSRRPQTPRRGHHITKTQLAQLAAGRRTPIARARHRAGRRARTMLCVQPHKYT